MSDLEKDGKKRRSFEKYDPQESGEFLRQVQADRRAMMQAEKKELLSVAEFAGIDFRDPETDEFSVDLYMEDDLDVSVQFDEKDGELYLSDPDADDETSITRMDEDMDDADLY
jgi:hypothetical protein